MSLSRADRCFFKVLFFPEFCNFSVLSFSLTDIDVHLPRGPPGPHVLAFSTLPLVSRQPVYHIAVRSPLSVLGVPAVSVPFPPALLGLQDPVCLFLPL